MKHKFVFFKIKDALLINCPALISQQEESVQDFSCEDEPDPLRPPAAHKSIKTTQQIKHEIIKQ